MSDSMHSALPSWQLEYQELLQLAINYKIHTEIKDKNNPLAYLAKSATSLGRKLRGTLALRYIYWEDLDKDKDEEKDSLTGMKEYRNVLKGLAQIELIHSASCILDDIIDQDTKRRGVESFHIRESMPKAILTALEMITMAVHHDTNSSKLQTDISSFLLKNFHQMVYGEAVDSFPLKDTQCMLEQEGEYNPEKALEVYSKKSTVTFSCAHELIGICYNMSLEKCQALAKYGSLLGKFYQWTNDYCDTFQILPNVRGKMDGEVTLNLSLPLIIALSYNQYEEYKQFIGYSFPRSELSKLKEQFKVDGIDTLVMQEIQKTKQEIISSYPSQGCNIPKELYDILNLIEQPIFWSYSYDNFG